MVNDSKMNNKDTINKRKRKPIVDMSKTELSRETSELLTQMGHGSATNIANLAFESVNMSEKQLYRYILMSKKHLNKKGSYVGIERRRIVLHIVRIYFEKQMAHEAKQFESKNEMALAS